MPEKSAFGPKASVIPIFAKVALRSKLDSSLKRGRKISTSVLFSFEIDLVDVGLVFAFGDVQKSWHESVALLRPQCIGDAQLNAFLFAGLLESALEFAEGGMESCLILSEVEYVSHLAFGVAP